MAAALEGNAPLSASTTFSAFDQLETIAKYFLGQAAAEQRQPEGGNKKLIADYLEKAGRILDKMVPYQLPRLASIDLTLQPLDLSKVTDAQLAALDAIVAAASNAGGDPDREGQTSH